VAAAANVQFDHVKDFGARKAMTDPDFLSKYPDGHGARIRERRREHPHHPNIVQFAIMVGPFKPKR